MASGLFFDPLVVLRSVPLVTTGATLLISFTNYSTIHMGLRVSTQDKFPTERAFFDGFRRYIDRTNFLFVSLTVATAVWNLRVRKPALVARDGAGWAYVIGATLAIGRYVLAPVLDRTVSVMTRSQDPEDWKGSLPVNLRICRLRILALDVPAFLACWYGLARTCVST